MRRVLSVAILSAILYVVICFFLAQSLTQAERHAVEHSPSDFGLAFREVAFPSREDGFELSGWYVAPPDPVAESAPTIVQVHGIHATREDDEALDITARLNAAGFAVFLFDLRGHGRSGGDEVSGGYFEQADLMGALDWVEGERGAGRPIGVLGRSMGAVIGLLTAEKDERIGALVADSPFARVVDMIPTETQRRTGIPAAIVPAFVPGMLYQAKLFFGIDVEAIAPVDIADRIDFPVVLIHGLSDTRISPEHSQRIHEVLAHREDSQLWFVRGADHCEVFKVAPDEFTERVVPYYRERLLGAGGD